MGGYIVPVPQTSPKQAETYNTTDDTFGKFRKVLENANTVEMGFDPDEIYQVYVQTFSLPG